MDKLIIGIAILFGGIWLLGVVLSIVDNFLNVVRQQWGRTRPGRERVGYAIGHPLGVLSATVSDHRLMSVGLVIVLSIGALFLARADSAWLISSADGIGGRDIPLLGWALLGGVAGLTMGIGSRVLELGWFGESSIRRVPDIAHLREGEAAAASYFRLRLVAAIVGAAILIVSLTLGYSSNAGYDPKADYDKKAAAISSAATEGRITILNAALDDANRRLRSDPKSGLKVLLVLTALSGDAVSPEVERVVKISRKYLDVFRDETEKLVTEGKPEALARSEAFLDVDRVAALKWLGRLYLSGAGGASKDESKAFSFYEEAAGLGDKTATTMLDKIAPLMVAAKDEGSRMEVFKYLEKKAQNGAPIDHYRLGQWYASSGKSQDQRRAERWLVKALTQDIDGTVTNLAFGELAKLKSALPTTTKALDAYAQEIAKGKEDALKKVAYAYLEQRANVEDPAAMLWMGFQYLDRKNNWDVEKAREWFLKAAKQDNNKSVSDKALIALESTKHAPLQRQNQPAKDDTSLAFGERGSVPKSLDTNKNQNQPTAVTRPQSSHSNAPPDNRILAPANSELNAYGNGWKCKRGYFQAGNECSAVQFPANSELNAYGNGWKCKRGYFQAGNECSAVQFPANSELNAYGNGWKCKRGYFQAGNECSAVQFPANSELNAYGNGWKCKRGYFQAGNECSAVQFPANSELNAYGNGWKCKSGFKLIDNRCIQIGFGN